MRLNRYLSACGVESRRGAEALILEGRVSINGKQVKDLATQVSEGDEVCVDARPVKPKREVVIILNKPAGYLCTRDDEKDRATIYDLLPAKFHDLHHVGRLDKESEGLILLTNRGELSQRLTHPSEGVEKEYTVRLDKQFDTAHIAKLLKGLHTAEGLARAERVYVENPYVVQVVLKQGLKRQIRLMFYQLGYEVERLIRVRIGGYKLEGLAKGQWKQLTEEEVERCFIKYRSRPRQRLENHPDLKREEEHVGPRRGRNVIRKPRKSSPSEAEPKLDRDADRPRKPFRSDDDDTVAPRRRPSSGGSAGKGTSEGFGKKSWDNTGKPAAGPRKPFRSDDDDTVAPRRRPSSGGFAGKGASEGFGKKPWANAGKPGTGPRKPFRASQLKRGGPSGGSSSRRFKKP